jgi:preprotein translocase subunit YajC
MIFSAFLTISDQAPGSAGQGSFITALVPFILVLVIFYLLIIMPSRKKQKKHQEMVEKLKPGDKIVTSGGIYGTVMGTKEDRVEVKISSNVKIDITKNAVAAILGQKKDEK